MFERRSEADKPIYGFDTVVRLSERVAWKLDDVLPHDAGFDFRQPFLPDALVGVEAVPFLSEREKLLLNQIRGHSYLWTFHFLEEYIVATTLEHAQAELSGDDMALRALLRFAEEEVKHRQLFERFRTHFQRGFGHECPVVEHPAAIAKAIRDRPPLAVLVATLHFELLTQQHYVETVRPGAEHIEPQFASLLRHHWIEEAQHAKIDVLQLHRMTANAGADALVGMFPHYAAILRAVDAMLAEQSGHDVRTLARITGREFTPRETAELMAGQHRSMRHAFLVMGLDSHTFGHELAMLVPDAPARLAQLRPAFA